MMHEEAIWASLPMPAFLLGIDALVVAVNSAAESFVRSSAKATIGAPFSDLISSGIALDDSLHRAQAHGMPVFVNDADLLAGGRTHCKCDIQIAPVSGQQNLFLLLISPRDLAGWVMQGHAVKSAARSAVGMAEMLAHEIKNPLAGITGAAQLLSMTLSDSDRELTDLIVSESRRIVALLDQVEQFGDVSKPGLRAVNLHNVVDRARRSAMLGVAADMHITEEYDPSLPMASGDPDQLVQVIQNLLKNAAEAAGAKGGRITLRSYYDASLRVMGEDGKGRALPLHIEVEDDGPGLPEAIAENVFEPFVSGRENGTGLGLALVAKIISAHDGWISVSSDPGRTVFRMSLPRAPDELKE